MALAGLPVAGKEFFDQTIGRKWANCMTRCAAKSCNVSAEMNQELARLFEPSGRGGNEERLCQVCGQEHPQTAPSHDDPDVEPVRRCPSCQAFEDLGDDLRNARYLLLDEIDPHPPADATASPGDWRQTPRSPWAS